MEKLNAETVTVENDVTGTAEEITKLTRAAGRISNDWQAVKTKLNAQRAALKQSVTENEDNLKLLGIGIGYIAFAAAATTGAVLGANAMKKKNR